MKTFDNILNKTIKVLLAAILCIMFIIGLLFVSPVYVHADTYNFPTLPIFVNQTPYALEFSVTYVTKQNVSQEYWVAVDREGVYGFIAPSTISPDQFTFYYAIPSDTVTPFTTYTLFSTTSSNYRTAQTFDSTNHITYGTYPYYNVSIIADCPTFDSLETALSTLRNYIDNPPANDYEGFRLPAGYVAAIQGSNVSFNMYTDMPEYSSIKQWAYSTQRYGIESSLPSQASYNYDYGTRIIWNITGDTNLLGEGYHAAASLSANVGSGYLMLVNPAYYGSTANIMNADMFNGVVTLSNISGITSIRLYSLGSYIGSGGITSDYSTDSAIQNAAVVATNGGFYIEGENGELKPITDLPSFGDTSTDGSSSGLIAKFRAILEGLVEKIESLLIAPVEYINRLITAASNFFAWLSGLWSWLPPAVSGVLTSVLYIMAIVGALKILWR